LVEGVWPSVTDDGRPWSTPEFWAAHYANLLAEEGAQTSDVIRKVFGLDPPTVYAHYQRHMLHPPSVRHATAPVQVARDCMVVADCVDYGVDGYAIVYLVNCADWPAPEVLGYESPHWALPALRLEELAVICKATVISNGSACAVLAVLLLMPGVWLTDSTEERGGRDMVSAALDGMLAGFLARPDEFVARLVRSQSKHVNWHRDRQLGWINDGPYSLRNPRSDMWKASPGRFDRIREFIDRVGGAATVGRL